MYKFALCLNINIQCSKIYIPMICNNKQNKNCMEPKKLSFTILIEEIALGYCITVCETVLFGFVFVSTEKKPL